MNVVVLATVKTTESYLQLLKSAVKDSRNSRYLKHDEISSRPTSNIHTWTLLM
jgi:hypothetical protein